MLKRVGMLVEKRGYASTLPLKERKKSNISFNQEIHGVTPDMAVKSSCVGGLTHQISTQIGSAQGNALAICY